MAGSAGSAVYLGRVWSGDAPNGFNDEWDDLPGPVAQAGGVSALTYEQYRDAPFFHWFMRHDQDDALYYTFQMRHSWKRGSAVHLHTHFVPMSSWVGAPATKTIAYEVAHVWVPSLTTPVPAAIGWTTTPCPIAVTSAQQYDDLIAELLAITPPAGALESSILRCRIRRLGSTGVTDTYSDNKVGGTPAANVAITDVDCHYQRSKAGTVTEYPT